MSGSGAKTGTETTAAGRRPIRQDLLRVLAVSYVVATGTNMHRTATYRGAAALRPRIAAVSSVSASCVFPSKCRRHPALSRSRGGAAAKIMSVAKEAASARYGVSAGKTLIERSEKKEFGRNADRSYV